MHLIKLLRLLPAVGTIFLLVGELFVKVGSALTVSNLGTGSADQSVQPGMSQDPPTLGVENEKPDEEQRDLFV